MATLGSLPEASPRRPSLLKWFLAAVALAAVLLVAFIAVLLVRFKGSREKEESKIDALIGELKRPVRPPPDPVALQRRIDELESRLRLIESAPRAAPPADENRTKFFLRLLELESRECVDRLIMSLMLSHDREAISHLARAMAVDPDWFRRDRPEDLFPSAEEHRKCLARLEVKTRLDPQDAEARTLLAYLYYHDRGAAYSRAILQEAVHVRPENAEAKQFLDRLDR